jgi:hypothetical protein
VREKQEISAGYSGAGCEFPQATHRQGEGKTGHFLRLHTGRVRAKQDISSGYTQAG